MPATVVSFTSVGTTTWTAPPNVFSVTYLVVGGGGGGGSQSGNNGGGGGGAGGFLTGTMSVFPGNVYTVTVGGGGSAAGPGNGGNGGNSVFNGVTSIGGGGGSGTFG